MLLRLYKISKDKATVSNSRTAFRNLRRCVMIACAGAVLAGCAVAGNSLPEITDGNQLVTGSVARDNKPSGIEESDAELIKNTVANVYGFSPSKPINWSNPETGATGSIVSLEGFKGRHGQKCRGFKTTVQNFSGIGYYNGEACQSDKEDWVLSWFKAAD